MGGELHLHTPPAHGYVTALDAQTGSILWQDPMPTPMIAGLTSTATAMGVWNVATAGPQVVAPLLAGPIVVRFNALAPGLGPRAAIVLALAEFVLGTALLWRLPATHGARSPS